MLLLLHSTDAEESVPSHLGRAIAEGNHGDAIVHRADNRAEIATDTIFFANFGNRFAGDASRAEAVAVRVHQVNALVSAVFAGDVAQIAADAPLVIDPGDPLIVQVQGFPVLQRRHGLAHKFRHAPESIGVQVIVQSLDHVLHDAEAVVHDGGADLHTG